MNALTYLGLNQPAVVQWDIEQVEDDALGGVFKNSDACELHIHVQARLQLVEDRHGIAHVLYTQFGQIIYSTQFPFCP